MINMPGGPELMVIILVALIVLGPEQLPKAMRTFGNVMAEI
ncbi:MAG: twin-arginine translocase TatA/TatE family subunit, partial [Acidimicrobiales bacterium]